MRDGGSDFAPMWCAMDDMGVRSVFEQSNFNDLRKGSAREMCSCNLISENCISLKRYVARLLVMCRKHARSTPTRDLVCRVSPTQHIGGSHQRNGLDATPYTSSEEAPSFEEHTRDGRLEII
mmetsp:Transcript_40896/g.123292  ORF Transcript_40896/g.123292 Transcript_40896/m.123292 type:complete len:122 (-) Transcript_40896:100-465(-)